MRYTDTSLMPFGKYKGMKLANVPAQYFIWMFEKGMRDSPLKTYIGENIDVMKV